MNQRPINTTYETWPIAHLAGLIRHGLDDQKVLNLVQSLKSGGELPAIFVLVDGPKQQILDGHHRVAAWSIAGYAAAPVLVLRPR